MTSTPKPSRPLARPRCVSDRVGVYSVIPMEPHEYPLPPPGPGVEWVRDPRGKRVIRLSAEDPTGLLADSKIALRKPWWGLLSASVSDTLNGSRLLQQAGAPRPTTLSPDGNDNYLPWLQHPYLDPDAYDPTAIVQKILDALSSKLLTGLEHNSVTHDWQAPDYVERIKTRIGSGEIAFELLIHTPHFDTAITQLAAVLDAKLTGITINGKLGALRLHGYRKDPDGDDATTIHYRLEFKLQGKRSNQRVTAFVRKVNKYLCERGLPTVPDNVIERGEDFTAILTAIRDYLYDTFSIPILLAITTTKIEVIKAVRSLLPTTGVKQPTVDKVMPYLTGGRKLIHLTVRGWRIPQTKAKVRGGTLDKLTKQRIRAESPDGRVAWLPLFTNTRIGQSCFLYPGPAVAMALGVLRPETHHAVSPTNGLGRLHYHRLSFLPLPSFIVEVPSAATTAHTPSLELTQATADAHTPVVESALRSLHGFGESQVGAGRILWTLRRGRFSLMLWLDKSVPSPWSWLRRRVAQLDIHKKRRPKPPRGIARLVIWDSGREVLNAVIDPERIDTVECVGPADEWAGDFATSAPLHPDEREGLLTVVAVRPPLEAPGGPPISQKPVEQSPPPPYYRLFGPGGFFEELVARDNGQPTTAARSKREAA